MSDINRRDFLKTFALTTAGIVTAGSVFSLASCSDEDKKGKADSNALAALRVSSDLYKTTLAQRFAFSIFNSDAQVVSAGSIPITLTAPSGKKQEFAHVKVRNKGIPGKGIFSVMAVLDEAGSWSMKTEFKNKPLELAFSVNEISIAPALNTQCPDGNSPTTADPKDATILCTRFEGNCGHHEHSIPELLSTGKPFVVLFATPARCQTSYCGPVLDLMATSAKSHPDIPAVHVEIYQNETTNDLLDAVTQWHLESEPWMFGIKAGGIIDSRLDGAFDQSEIEAVFSQLQ